MTSDADMTLEEFASLAEAWGGDIARWPGNTRIAARRLLVASPEARRALAEAAALDRLLAIPDAASAMPADAALVDRIVAAAHRTPRAVPRSAPEPVSTPLVARLATVPSTPRSIAAPTSRRTSTFGRVEIGGGAALLAASMVLGIFVGGSRLADGALPALEELTGITISSPAHSLALAAGEVDEDL
ncbi:MAG: hypothetical protein KGP27_05835 [Hyphomicrobiales bacterium]|nr:hypothetical protein [Hyphomicrobiales bacterium]